MTLLRFVVAVAIALATALGRQARVQYAALPWRWTDEGEVEVLLVTSRGRRRWLLPKGWPIAGMSPASSAAQEAFEEAGVRGQAAPQALGGYLHAKKLGGARQPVRVSVFPLKVTHQAERWPEQFQRQRRWAPPDTAAALVKSSELAALIKSFAPEGRERSGGVSKIGNQDG